MSHIHIPDGVLPIWIILIGWVIAGGVLYYASRHYVGQQMARRLPLVGVMSALMVVVQSITLLPIGYHFNLTVLGGVILGPALGLVAVFVVNLILAFFGHGGITVVGLNTLVFGIETLLGYHLFRGLRGALGRRLGVGLAVGGATLVSLMVGALLMIGIVAASAIDPGWQAPEAPEGLVLPNPMGGEPIVVEMPRPEDGDVPPLVVAERFAVLVVLLGLIGWPIEAVVTGLIAGYIYSVRPDLLEPSLSPEQQSSRKADRHRRRKH